tara:strand:- start:1172 stop:1879 length:708 start_codon:yes stop_codon:yes gene_type:complete
MNNIRLFFKESLSNNLTGELNKDQSHYLLKVMRIKKGDKFNLFNENGEWVAYFDSIKSGLVNFELGKQIRSKEHKNELWLAFSPIKSNFFNFMIQKTTELGVTNFIPIIFDRSVVRKINLERLRKIVVEASEQSNRINIPNIEEPTTLVKFLNRNVEKMNLIFTDLNSKNTNLDNKKLLTKPNCVIIGPEGDFSEPERVEISKFKDIYKLSLSENILRSETAAISAISIVGYELN